jgi:hypothetical protein
VGVNFFVVVRFYGSIVGLWRIPMDEMREYHAVATIASKFSSVAHIVTRRGLWRVRSERRSGHILFVLILVVKILLLLPNSIVWAHPGDGRARA